MWPVAVSKNFLRHLEQTIYSPFFSPSTLFPGMHVRPGIMKTKPHTRSVLEVSRDPKLLFHCWGITADIITAEKQISLI